MLTALQKTRADRFQSAEDFRWALDNAARGLVVRAPGASADAAGAHGAGAGAAAAGLAAAAAYGGRAHDQTAGGYGPDSTSMETVDDPYTTATGEQPQLEEAGVSGFFPQAQDEYSEDELYENERNEAVAAKRRRRAAWKNTILGLVILLLAATAAGAWLYYSHELNKPVYVDVPAVRNVAQDQAEESLRNEGLKVTVKKEYDDSIPSGSAIKTDPREGTQVEKDSTVTLVVSEGPANLTIPTDFAGQSEAYVRSQLEKMGLVAGSTKTVHHPSIPAGMVVDTDPAQGQQVANGSTVNLVLSDGKVAVPQLVGLTRDQAVAALTDKDVLLSTQIETEHSSQPAGTVIRQSAAAETAVAQGSTITITVSQGPAGTTRTASPTPSASASAAEESTEEDSSEDRSPAGDAAPTASATPSPSASRRG
ncbi:Serine/threonine-protein kinase PrkC [Rothia kristinae]|nr:Serine/threonine-protein kinase PrkC [Rothia kristinae]